MKNKTLSVTDLSPRWSSAACVWSDISNDSNRKFAYECRGEFIAFSSETGYVGPFATKDSALAAVAA
jgi:hypothetical protein